MEWDFQHKSTRYLKITKRGQEKTSSYVKEILLWKQSKLFGFLDLAVAKSLQSTRTVTDDADADDDDV